MQKNNSKKLSILQILKQNTSFSIKSRSMTRSPILQASSKMTSKLRKTSEDFLKEPLNQLTLMKSTQKFNASDSESLSDKEEQIKELESAKRRRKSSMDSFLQKEKDVKKKLNIKKEKLNILLRKEKIVIEVIICFFCFNLVLFHVHFFFN